MNWLREQGLRGQLDTITVVHSSLHDPAGFHYVHSTSTAAQNFAAQLSEISFHGHTHVPLVWEESSRGVACLGAILEPRRLTKGFRYAINPGSVGQPRDDNPDACYALYDPVTRTFSHRRVPYDIKRAQARFQKADLAPDNYLRLAEGR